MRKKPKGGRMIFHKSITLVVAGAALAGLTSLAGAQSTDALVDKYTPLAGSQHNAQQLVDGLRKGGDFKVGTTSIDNANRGFGNGEINIALSLSQADMTKNHLTLEAALEDVLRQRAGGGGWGKIANDMGFRLGDLVRSDRARGGDDIARNERREARIERLDRPDKPERAERPERPERPERANR
jgi:hypothetical protein